MVTAVKFSRLFGAKNVLLELNATTKDDALSEIIEFLEKNEVLDTKAATGALKAVKEREKIGSTGIGGGVAIPHAKSKAVSERVVALARSADGLDFHSVDGEPVHILFLIVSPPDEQEQHLEGLRWVSKLVRNRDFCTFFKRAENVREVQGLLREMGDE